MTKEFFEEIMRIPSCSRHEDMMQEYLLQWAGKHGCSAKKDGKGNILMVKGKPPAGQFYPGFCNHIDTVHHDQIELVNQRTFKEIKWSGDNVTAVNPLLPKHGPQPTRGFSSWKGGVKSKFGDKNEVVDVELQADGTYSASDKKDDKATDDKATDDKKDGEKEEKKEEKPVEMGKQTGLGMDDQGGCAIALAVLDTLRFGKAMFVVEEETGMQGSIAADMHFFDDCAFVFSNDSPDRNRGTHYSSGVQLYSDEFFNDHLRKICADHGLTDFRSEPFTDIIQVRRHELPDGKHLECLNFGNGGYNAHCETEYAKFSDVCAAEDLLRALCTGIPLDKQYSSEIKSQYSGYGGYGGSYGGYSGGGYSGGGYSGGGYSGGGYSGGGYSGGGYSAWRASQSNYDDDDDWWNRITGRGTTNRDFANHQDDDACSFSFLFKSPDVASTAAMALKRLQKTTGEDNLKYIRNSDKITVTGTLRSLKYAYMTCFNAQNQTKYAIWNKFLTDVKGSKDAFEKAVSFKKAETAANGKNDRGDHGKNENANSQITIYFDDDEDLVNEFKKMCKDTELDVKIGTDEYGSVTVEGELSDVKLAWTYACGLQSGKDVYEFEDLNKEDIDEFWNTVQTDDVKPENIDDDDDDDDDDIGQFWSWYDKQDK